MEFEHLLYEVTDKVDPQDSQYKTHFPKNCHAGCWPDGLWASGLIT